jgi:hypothetical protein
MADDVHGDPSAGTLLGHEGALPSTLPSVPPPSAVVVAVPHPTRNARTSARITGHR